MKPEKQFHAADCILKLWYLPIHLTLSLLFIFFTVISLLNHGGATVEQARQTAC